MTDRVAAVMLTVPNTLGVFERRILEISKLVHERGGFIYMDGANLNAFAGRALPGTMGADAMHINLHKTFSTPHGGGGPGAGPVRSPKPCCRICRYREWSSGRPASACLGRRRLDRRHARLLRQLPDPGQGAHLHPGHGIATVCAKCRTWRCSTPISCVTAQGAYHLKYESPACTRWYSTTADQSKHEVHNTDIAKRLLDSASTRRRCRSRSSYTVPS